MKNDECLICGNGLEYLEINETMECVFCHQIFTSKTRCKSGHFVCDECHSQGILDIISFCLKETSKNPHEIIHRLMDMPFCHMHGPEHHIMVGASLLTAYKNAGGDIDLNSTLAEMYSRGKQVPGGVCGFWGSCGAAVSTGIFISIITKANPFSGKEWGLTNLMTSQALYDIGSLGGPRCCKRNSHTAINSAINFVKDNFGIKMENNTIICSYSQNNNQCIGKRCPFNEVNYNG